MNPLTIILNNDDIVFDADLVDLLLAFSRHCCASRILTDRDSTKDARNVSFSFDWSC